MPKYRLEGKKGEVTYRYGGQVYEPGEHELEPSVAKKLWATPVGDAPRATRTFEAQVAESAAGERADATKTTRK